MPEQKFLVGVPRLLVRAHSLAVDEWKMLSLARCVDRGRFLVGVMIVAPLGAMISVPSGPAQPVSAQWEVTRGVSAAVEAIPLAASSPTPAQILAQVSSPGEPAQAGSPITVSSDLVNEGGELDVSQPLVGYIPGTPPDAPLAATLRLAQSRFSHLSRVRRPPIRPRGGSPSRAILA